MIFCHLEANWDNVTNSVCHFGLHFLHNLAAFEIQVLSTSAIKCRGDFRILQFASAIRRQKNAKDSTETFLYYVGNCFGLPRHFAKGYALES